jgi:hypothetical protein
MTTTFAANGSATLLHNGQVLLAGGGAGSTSADLYNPVTGTFSPTGSMTSAHNGEPATLLQGGEVLFTGGENPSSEVLASAELYNPVSGTWALTGGMTTARTGGTATLLQNGEVLVAGGGNSTLLSSSELYNPATGKWTTTGSGAVGHFQQVLLPNGDVLALAGGFTELYNPATGNWSPAARFADVNQFAVTLLDTGKVLLAADLHIPRGPPTRRRPQCFTTRPPTLGKVPVR